MSAVRQILSENSPSAPGAVAGTLVFTGLRSFRSLLIHATLQGAVGGTLDVYLQVYDGANWIDYAHFVQLAAAAPALTYAFPISRDHSRETPLTPVGQDSSPLLAADTVVGGDFGDKMRVLFVAGAGTTAGALQTIKAIGTFPLS